MTKGDFPSGWRDPQFVATVVGVLATGALFFYSGFVESAPSPQTIQFVLLWVFIPTTAAYESARRWL